MWSWNGAAVSLGWLHLPVYCAGGPDEGMIHGCVAGQAPPGSSDLTHTISMSPHAHCFLFTGKSDVLAQMGFLEVCAVLILRIHQFCCPCFIAEICVAVLKSAQISIRPPQTVWFHSACSSCKPSYLAFCMSPQCNLSCLPHLVAS